MVFRHKKIMELQEENLALKMKLEELSDLCLMCSTKMNAHICLLQEEIMKSMNVKSDDIILLGLAGLKQVAIWRHLASIILRNFPFSIAFLCQDPRSTEPLVPEHQARGAAGDERLCGFASKGQPERPANANVF